MPGLCGSGSAGGCVGRATKDPRGEGHGEPLLVRYVQSLWCSRLEQVQKELQE